MFLSLADKINLPILVEPYLKRGKELAASHKILDQIPQILQKSSPELFLMDSLYFNQGIFEKIVNGLGAHFIVKSRRVDEHYGKRAEGRRDESFFAVCSDLDEESSINILGKGPEAYGVDLT